ncbi:FAD-dependent oxidoreductase [Streptomyces sp. NPDC001108]
MESARSSRGAGAGHAVVVGAGVGGLCAVRALSESFTHVTLVERDTVTTNGTPRRGVPQGAHVHSLTSRGATVLEEFFPGFIDELAAEGATVAEALGELDIVFFGSRLRRVPLDRVVQVSRPFLEDRLRDKVRALPNVTFRHGMEAVGPVAGDGTRVTGVRLSRPGVPESGEVLDADLVVDAMGRAGRGATWLKSLGYQKPSETRLGVDVGYASRRFRVAADAVRTDKGVLIGATPARPRGLVLTRQENDLWVLSQYGFGRRNHPPATHEEFLPYAQELLPVGAWETLQDAEPVTDVTAFTYPASVRRDFHRLRELPDGLLSTGDALCSLNPIYGAGMTVAALEAVALRACLADGTRDLPRRFYKAAARASYLPWLFSTMADRALPFVPGTRPVVARTLAASFRATMRAASADAHVAAAVWNAVSLTGSPSALARPRVLASVLREWSPRTGSR